jgi:hypothetical protein
MEARTSGPVPRGPLLSPIAESPASPSPAPGDQKHAPAYSEKNPSGSHVEAKSTGQTASPPSRAAPSLHVPAAPRGEQSDMHSDQDPSHAGKSQTFRMVLPVREREQERKGAEGCVRVSLCVCVRACLCVCACV